MAAPYGEPPHTPHTYNASIASATPPVHAYPPQGTNSPGSPPPVYGQQPLVSTGQNGEPVYYFAANNAYDRPAYAGPAYANPSQPAQTPVGYETKGNLPPFPAQGNGYQQQQQYQQQQPYQQQQQYQQQQFGPPPPGTTVYVNVNNPVLLNDGGLSSMAFICFVVGWCFPLAWYIGIFDIRNKNPNIRVWAYVDTVLAVLTTIGIVILIIEIIALQNAVRSGYYP